MHCMHIVWNECFPWLLNGAECIGICSYRDRRRRLKEDVKLSSLPLSFPPIFPLFSLPLPFLSPVLPSFVPPFPIFPLPSLVFWFFLFPSFFQFYPYMHTPPIPPCLMGVWGITAENVFNLKTHAHTWVIAHFGRWIILNYTKLLAH